MPTGSSALDEHKVNVRFFALNAVISLAVLAFLAWLLLLRSTVPGGADLGFLPAVNAGFNALAAAFLVAGWVFVKQRRLVAHRNAMIAAFGSSALFFASYVAYHYAHGDTKYTGEGALRLVYFVILATHVVLSMAVVPLALTALWFAYKRRFDRHTRVTRVLLPIWLYVSVTGVVIFFMLRGAAS
jgi:putative membrane protein